MSQYVKSFSMLMLDSWKLAYTFKGLSIEEGSFKICQVDGQNLLGLYDPLTWINLNESAVSLKFPKELDLSSLRLQFPKELNQQISLLCPV
jgi:hypothetical protein